MQKKTPFSCSVLNTEIRVPCELRSCRFNVDFPWNDNCILSYMQQHRNQALSVSEIAFLHRKSVDSVASTLNSAVMSLRRSILRTDVPGGRTVLYGANLCVACESTAVPGVRVGGFLYCDRDCSEEYTPSMAKIERTFERSPTDVLSWCWDKIRDRDQIPQFLGCGRHETAALSDRLIDQSF